MAVVGWDIGGAHLKAARCEEGRIVATAQVAAPLRLGLERLVQAFAEAKALIGSANSHAVTMTGELADTFSSRAEGVACLTGAAVRELAPGRVVIYAGRAGFVAPADAANHVPDIASANWFASASVVGKRIGSSLFVDTGSTTTDIVPIVNGAVAADSYTDGERLVKGELVYTGLVRSFLMATAERVPFAGSWSALIHENFSTMADVHRSLGSLADGADQMASADGRAKTIAASQARLARWRDAGPTAGLRGSVLRSPVAPSRMAVCWCCREGNCPQARQSSLRALAQICSERWRDVFLASASISRLSSTYRLRQAPR